MSSITPGPWQIQYGGISESDEGFGIGSKVEPGFGTIAECWPCITDIEKRRAMLANAKAISEVPRMLQVLREFVEVCDRIGPGYMEDSTADLAREILKNVEGYVRTD